MPQALNGLIITDIKLYGIPTVVLTIMLFGRICLIVYISLVHHNVALWYKIAFHTSI